LVVPLETTAALIFKINIAEDMAEKIILGVNASWQGV
jgi:hypothetical protein